ncbi:MAG TPA: hypothetical protein VGZ93_05090 [Candidatus Methylacidiphilales bacterium]|jgi:hypothetical protein|nr:hypothetical protein [Candidatus Methylacidiphilales bacterium]
MQGASIAWQCLNFAAPFLAVAAVWWLINRIDRIINRLFPDLEWEKKLGWLNIRAERRVNLALRWIGYCIYALLGVALYGIAWAAEGLQQLPNWSDPQVLGDLALRIPVLGICLGAWILYLGGWLIPKLRAEREEAGLKKFRAEMREAEREGESEPPSRIHAPPRKPRTNAPRARLVPSRIRRRL